MNPNRILIVEDDRMLTDALGVYLLQSNFEVKTAGNMKEAILTLKSWPPHLIILDLVLPSHHGFEILEIIKKRQQWQQIPVIITSNLSDSQSIKTAKKLGAIEYIVKSDLSLKALVDKIEAILNG